MPASLKSVLCCFRPTASGEGETSRAARYAHESSSSSAGSSPSASGMLAGLASLRQRSRQAGAGALTDDECQLGGYLQDRQISGRPVAGEDFERLMRGHETVMQVRQALAHGRGNQEDDVDYSNGQSSIRAEAGRLARGMIPNRYDEPVRVAASALAAQAGNCGEHAYVAAFLHAGKLQDGEQSCIVSDVDGDHSWAELRGAHLDRGQHVVMDPWGKGPAIFADDGDYSSREHALTLEHTYDRKTGARAHAQMRKLQRRHGHRLQTEVHRQMNELGPDFRYPNDGLGPGRTLWRAEPVVSSAFADAAFDRMIEEPNAAYLAPPHGSYAPQWAGPVQTNERWMAPLRQEILGTGTARTLGAYGVQGVTQAGMRIADVALDPRGYPLAPHPAQYLPEDD